MNSNKLTFDRWNEGELSDEQTLRELLEALEQVKDRLEPLEAETKKLREQLSIVVYRMGDRVDVPGYGRVENTAPTLTVSYDRTRLDNLVSALLKEGHRELAERINECRRESPRSGYFKITPTPHKERGDGDKE